MKNKTLNWIVFGVVVLGAVWYLTSMSSRSGEGLPEVATTTTQSVPDATPQAGLPTAPATVKNTPAPVTAPKVVTRPKLAGIREVSYLVGLREPLVCSITTSGQLKRSGTLYVGGIQYRVDFPSSSMISDGTYLYTWKSGAANGLKLLSSSSVSGSAMASNGGFDPGTGISFECNTWAENASIFTPPSSVTFSNSL